MREICYGDALNTFISDNEPKLLPEQRQAYDRTINATEQVFFFDASGGTRKAFLTNLLLAKVRSGHTIALASSGIAATLLTGSRTAHSTFKQHLKRNCNG